MSFSRRKFVTGFLPAAIGAPLLVNRAAAKPGSIAEIFRHGVASGDPMQHAVIIWTRISQQKKKTSVRWQLGADAEFRTILKSGKVKTSAEHDYTVKVDLTGLRPATTYYYRFKVGKLISPAGTTKTLPVGDVSQVKLGLASCANYSFGYFNVYRLLAERDDLDAIVHLGDYLYEYEAGGYDSEHAEAMGRATFPRHEIISLDDYRGRHAQYKSDPDLQALHARYPFITSWDDHETANDSWINGAENHNDGEGKWARRKSDAVQAYYEWMPIREPPDKNRACSYRSFQFGNLASLIMLESRLCGREQALNYGKDLPLQEREFDFSDPQQPRLHEIDSSATADLRSISVPFDVSGEQPVPITDYARIKNLDPKNMPAGIAFLPDIDRFKNEVLADPSRDMLGTRQEAWLEQQLQDSKQAGTPWQVIGNQTIMANINAPDLRSALTTAEIDALDPRAQRFVEFSDYALPYNLDAWDGYPAARRRILDAFLREANNTVVLSGDSHNAWANEIAQGDRNCCVEIGVPSVTSPGVSQILQLDADKFAKMMQSRNAHIRYTNTGDRGYVVLSLTAQRMQANYYFIDTILSTKASVRLEKSVTLNATESTGTAALELN
ncbi:MAG: alkaline phosphatase D family protein [Pseudomonadales bacterium]